MRVQWYRSQYGTLTGTSPSTSLTTWEAPLWDSARSAYARLRPPSVTPTTGSSSARSASAAGRAGGCRTPGTASASSISIGGGMGASGARSAAGASGGLAGQKGQARLSAIADAPSSHSARKRKLREWSPMGDLPGKEESVAGSCASGRHGGRDVIDDLMRT